MNFLPPTGLECLCLKPMQLNLQGSLVSWFPVLKEFQWLHLRCGVLPPVRVLEGERTASPCGAVWNDGNNGFVASSSAAVNSA